MMKSILLFCIFLIVTSVSAQETEEINFEETDISCESGIKEAERDINDGMYKLLTYGMVMYKDFEFRKFHIEYVKEKYGVILGDGGCVVSEKTICYTETMEKAIIEKFGQDFFSRAESEALKAYKSKSE